MQAGHSKVKYREWSTRIKTGKKPPSLLTARLGLTVGRRSSELLAGGMESLHTH